MFVCERRWEFENDEGDEQGKTEGIKKKKDGSSTLIFLIAFKSHFCLIWSPHRAPQTQTLSSGYAFLSGRLWFWPLICERWSTVCAVWCRSALLHQRSLRLHAVSRLTKGGISRRFITANQIKKGVKSVDLRKICRWHRSAVGVCILHSQCSGTRQPPLRGIIFVTQLFKSQIII